MKSQVLNFRYVEGILNNWAKMVLNNAMLKVNNHSEKFQLVNINGGKMNKEKTNRVLEYFDELFQMLIVNLIMKVIFNYWLQ